MAPAPVWIPHPSAANFLRSSIGVSSGRATTLVSRARICRPILDWPKKKWLSSLPCPSQIADEPSERRPEKFKGERLWQYAGAPSAQVAQLPQWEKLRMTLVPGLRLVLEPGACRTVLINNGHDLHRSCCGKMYLWQRDSDRREGKRSNHK